MSRIDGLELGSPNRNLISTTDANGNTTSYTYDSRGDLLTTTDPQGHTTNSTYNGQGEMLTSTSVTGVTTDYSYGPSNQVTSTIEQWINPTPADGLPNTNLTTSSTYDSDGRQTSSTDANGNTTHTYYTADGQVDHTIDSLGNTTSYVYDASGNLIQTTNPDGTVTRTAYDALNRATLTLDSFIPGDPTYGSPLGTATIFNDLGQAIETDRVSGAMIQIEADPTHPGMMMAVMTNPGTVISKTTTTYNPDGSVASTTDDLGQVTTFTYNAAGQQSSQTLVNVPVFNPSTKSTTLENLTTSTTYNADGQQTATTDAEGNVTHSTYDADGNLVATSQPNGASTVNTYNSLGQMTASTDALDNTTTYAYDAAGNLVSVIEPIIKIESADDQSKSLVAPTTTYTYDAYGDELTQADANGNTTKFEYDSQGRQIAEILPMGQSDSTVYDSQGRVSKQFDFDGNTTQFTYNSLGQVTTIVYTGAAGSGKATQTVTYTYDALGRQHTETDPTGTTTYTYDNAGNLITEATPEGTMHYVYNALDQHVETYTTAVGGTAVITDIVYTYDALGRMSTMTVMALNGLELTTPLVTDYYYDANGNLAYQLQANNNVSQTFTYTPENQVASITDRTGTTVTAAYTYTYDADGRETQEVQTHGSQGETSVYTYNADGMLYSETASGDAHGSIFYGYDADGNRLETNSGDFINGSAGDFGASFWTYNANNEMTGSVIPIQDQDDPGQTSSTYTYDNNGSLVEEDDDQSTQDEDDGDSFNSEVYTYDARGNMIKLVNQNGTTTYTYDDAGNRVKEVTPVSGRNVTTTYLADPENPQGYAQTIEEHTNGAAVPSITYFVGLNGTQGQTNGSTVIYMLRDNRGYARIFTNSSGTVTQYDDFDAFGNQTTSNNITATTHYFPDGVLDVPSGLTFHFGGRQSSSFNGDFIERDGQQFGDNQNPLTLNRYVLDDDNSISNIDPSGHDGVDELIGFAGIDSVIGLAATRSTTNPTTQPQNLFQQPTRGVFLSRDAIQSVSNSFNCGAWAFNLGIRDPLHDPRCANFLDQLNVTAPNLDKMLASPNYVALMAKQVNDFLKMNSIGLTGNQVNNNYNQPSPAGWHLVKLYEYSVLLGFGGRDFHWITQDVDSNWSGKGGLDNDATSTSVGVQDTTKNIVGTWLINTPPRSPASDIEDFCVENGLIPL